MHFSVFSSFYFNFYHFSLSDFDYLVLYLSISSCSFRSPISPQAVSGGGTGTPPQSPIFKFTDPALNARALTFKEQLLQWCQAKTKEYEVLFCCFYLFNGFCCCFLYCTQRKIVVVRFTWTR